MGQDQYQVDGSLKGTSSSYVYRKADFQLYEALKEGKFCYVFNIIKQIEQKRRKAERTRLLEQSQKRQQARDLSR